jgi:succinate dehydrogenase flavin-adding protein (antitoxin of CptAB toxin-antitoxin module)
MDYLLGRFAEQAIDSMNGDDIALLERLIEMPDPQIELSVLEGYSLGERDLDALVDRIRRYHGLPQAG